MAFSYSYPGGTWEKDEQPETRIQLQEVLYVSKEVNKENALALEGQSCTPE